MAGSSSMIAMRRAMAAQYSPWRARRSALPPLCQNCSPLCPRRAVGRAARAGGMLPTTSGELHMQVQQSARHWSDILWFLFVSAILGLTCGLTAGGVALLLAAPAYGKEAGAGTDAEAPRPAS